MHREISHAERAFHQERDLSLYLLTALLGLIIAADLWPLVASWEPFRSWGLPTWPREIGGYRLALLAAILGGARTLYGSLNSLLDGRIGADLALAIAVVAAILVGEPLVAAEVVFIGMLGECLESLTFERTQRAVRKLAEVFPRRCWLLRDGQEVRVLVDEVQIGDRVVVKPGAKVPVDGVVIDGRSALDLSALTGESLPAEKGPGDEVLAGALNGTGALTIEAKRVREQTVAGRVIELTARALQERAPIERTADRLARWFLPVVLGLAALTFLAGLVYYGTSFLRPEGAVRLSLGEAARLAIYPTLSVLVVACPCALILATPAAIIAALGRLAGTGILIKGGAALERLAGVDAFVFDKTGTLTEGRLELGDVVPLGAASPDEVLRVAAIAEQRSEHPLARLIVQEATARGATPQPIDEFQAHPGGGVTARCGDETLAVGTPRFLEETGGIVLPPGVGPILERLDATGQTALLVARGRSVLGIVGARDRVRPEAKAVVAELRGLGVTEVALLTGDRSGAARVVAEAVEIADARSGLLPQEKAADVAARKRAGRRVAVVGDGINDAPALAGADVGLAVAGIEAVAEAGDIVLMGDPLRHLPLLVRLSRATVTIIRQNILIFAFGVNAVGILVTAWLWPLLAPAGWVEQGPIAAVIYHQLGSVAVLLNAMRLLRFERPASPAWRGWLDRFEAFNARAERLLDTHEALHWVADHQRQLTTAISLLLFAAWALSGLTQIEAGEVAVVRRFGRPIEPDLGPGLYWRWPYPIEEVTRVRPDEVRTLPIGFRAIPGVAPSSLAWGSRHGEPVEDEAVMLTGDGNLVEVQATVRYAIASPRVFLFEVAEPEAILRSLTESVLREAVAGRSFAELLTAGRGPFADDVLRRLDERCRSQGPSGLGIRLDGLAVHDLHPPQEVVADYHNVTRAMEARERQKKQAEAEVLYNPRTLTQSLQLWREAEKGDGRTRLSLAEAHGLALQVVRQAQAERVEKVSAAAAGRDAFLARASARDRLPLRAEWQLLREAYDAVRRGQAPAIAVEEYRRRRREALQVQTVLTDFRIYWEALGRALAGRDKILIDADKVPGRRQLLMMNPEQFRIPMPMLGPPDRAPMRQGRLEGHEGP